MVELPTTSQNIKDIAVEVVTTNDLPLSTYEKSGIAKMLASMLDQLNLKLTVSNVRAWTVNTYQRKMIETKRTVAGNMVSVEIDLCTRRKCHFLK